MDFPAELTWVRSLSGKRDISSYRNSGKPFPGGKHKKWFSLQPIFISCQLLYDAWHIFTHASPAVAFCPTRLQTFQLREHMFPCLNLTLWRRIKKVKIFRITQSPISNFTNVKTAKHSHLQDTRYIKIIQ